MVPLLSPGPLCLDHSRLCFTILYITAQNALKNVLLSCFCHHSLEIYRVTAIPVLNGRFVLHFSMCVCAGIPLVGRLTFKIKFG